MTCYKNALNSFTYRHDGSSFSESVLNQFGDYNFSRLNLEQFNVNDLHLNVLRLNLSHNNIFELNFVYCFPNIRVLNILDTLITDFECLKYLQKLRMLFVDEKYFDAVVQILGTDKRKRKIWINGKKLVI
ncbi:Leucine-rich_repeat domain superfamily [Hexamita inflata]|uniref:Leucine-rich repeat domain superfamily n=1 Tax=Hexamita inflata TaxID=28002 RepID=A0AA86QS21_9EUKA|nr:Leucine-rich repeat domain superfamily [Hexamita inflata]